MRCRHKFDFDLFIVQICSAVVARCYLSFSEIATGDSVALAGLKQSELEASVMKLKHISIADKYNATRALEGYRKRDPSIGVTDKNTWLLLRAASR